MHESRLTDASGDRAGFVRLGGFAILAGLVIHVVANGFLKNFPPEDPTADQLAGYLAEEAGTWALVHGLRYIAVACIAVFAAVLFVKTCPKWGSRSTGWAKGKTMRRAMAAVLAVLLATFLDLGLTARAEPADEQRAVLITGASSGIGRMAAERLARAGYFVYAGARKQSDIEALDAIDNVKAVRLDVTSQEDIDAAVELIGLEGRGLWGLVNNAGVNLIAPLIEAEESELDFVFDVNVYGVFRVTKAFAPMIIDSGGRIVNISSISGILSGGLNGYGMYSMSKHAIEAFTDQLAWELGPLGVSVSAIEPGNFATQIGESRCERMLATQDERNYRYFAEDMQAYLSSCRERLDSDEPPSAPSPGPVAEAIEHAMFAETPKEHYLVVSEPIEAQITIGKAFEELLHLNHDHPYSSSREHLIKMMDSESAIVRGEKPRGMPGEI